MDLAVADTVIFGVCLFSPIVMGPVAFVLRIVEQLGGLLLLASFLFILHKKFLDIWKKNCNFSTRICGTFLLVIVIGKV